MRARSDLFRVGITTGGDNVSRKVSIGDKAIRDGLAEEASGVAGGVGEGLLSLGTSLAIATVKIKITEVSVESHKLRSLHFMSRKNHGGSHKSSGLRRSDLFP